MANYQDLQDLTPVLKSVYLPVRKKAFPRLTPLLAQVNKAGPERVKYAGNDLFFTVKLGRRGGFVSSSRGFLPEATSAAERQGRLGIARSYARIQVDGLSSRASEDSRGSYISLAKKMTEDVMEQWQFEQNRILHGDGMGIRAVVVAKGSSTSYTVNAPYGITGAGPGNLHLEIGDTVALHDASAAWVVLGKAKITNISLSGDTATLTFDGDIDGAGTAVAGDVLCTAVPTAVDTNDSSFGAEPHGLASIVDVEANYATFEGINHGRWSAQQISSTTIDETIVMKLLNTIRARGGVDWRTDPKSMLLLTTTGIWQTYGNSLLGLRRFTAPEMTLNGGFKAAQVAGAPIIDDPWCPRGRMYAMHTDDLVFIDLMDFGKLSFQDSPQWVRAADRDAFEAVYAAYWNFGCYVRNTHGVIYNITDTDNYSPIYF